MARHCIGALALLTVLLCINWSDALSCTPCDRSKCKTFLTSKDCEYGVGKDVCGCCDKCLKGPGEACEGLFNTSGICGRGLTCVGGDRNRPGKCVPIPKKPRCPCPVRCLKILRPPPQNCRHGHSRPLCGCFSVCKKDSGARCGQQIGDCRPGYYCKGQSLKRNGRRCTFRTGRCVRRKVDRCPRPFACPLIFKRPPTNCRYGHAKPICGCFSICRKGTGKRCGYVKGECQIGHYCRGRKYTVIKATGKVVYRSGRCVGRKGATEDCFARVPCNRRRCPRTGCSKYNSGKNRCACCPKCLRRSGQTCGNRHPSYTPCRKGLRCIGEKRVHGRYRPGRCSGKPTNTNCFVRVRCNRKRCPRTGCSKYNSGKNRCACCPKCLRRSGQTCGNRHPRYTPCRKGLKCIGEKRVHGRYRPGRCNGKRYCRLNKRHCNRRSCPKLRYCKYRQGTPKGLCCPTCRKGANRWCGDRYGLCRSGYKCKITRKWYLDPVARCYTKRGKCVKSYCSCNKRHCKRRRCPKIRNWRYKYATPKCGCCPVRKRESGQTCGDHDGVCVNGFECKISKLWFLDARRACYRRRGTCVRRVCGCNRICNRALCPVPNGCRYHWAKPKCICCAICKKGAGEACGDQDGVCRDGYECKLNNSWFLDGRRKCYRKRGTCTKSRPVYNEPSYYNYGDSSNNYDDYGDYGDYGGHLIVTHGRNSAYANKKHYDLGTGSSSSKGRSAKSSYQNKKWETFNDFGSHEEW